MLTLTDSTIDWLKKTANQLKGSVCRIFMAKTVRQSGYGGASAAEKKLGWNRVTIRKGKKEITSGAIEDKFSDRGRKKSEVIFPCLPDDIRKIVEPECQTDPSFNSCRLYTRLTAAEVRKRLLKLDGSVFPLFGIEYVRRPFAVTCLRASVTRIVIRIQTRT